MAIFHLIADDTRSILPRPLALRHAKHLPELPASALKLAKYLLHLRLFHRTFQPLPVLSQWYVTLSNTTPACTNSGHIDIHWYGVRPPEFRLFARWQEFSGDLDDSCLPVHWKLILSVQVEYAVKAVENGGTCIGIRCKDGVVLAVEKIITSKLLKPGANSRIATVDRNVGVVSASPLVSLRDITRYAIRYLQA